MTIDMVIMSVALWSAWCINVDALRAFLLLLHAIMAIKASS